jgi:hypothetical protein
LEEIPKNLESDPYVKRLIQQLAAAKQQAAISSGNYCATMQDMDVKFVPFDFTAEEMLSLQESLSSNGLLFNFLPSKDQMENCEVIKDPPRTEIGRTIPRDFQGLPRKVLGDNGQILSLATIKPAAHIHPHGKRCRKHFGTYSLIPFRLKLDVCLSNEQTERIVDSFLHGVRPKSESGHEISCGRRIINAGFVHSYANMICIENQCAWLDDIASLSFIPCFESVLDFWNYNGGPIKVIVMGATPQVIYSISATDSSKFESLPYDDPVVKNAFLTAEKVVAQVTNIILSKPDEDDLPNQKLCRDFRAWLRKMKEVPVLTPSATNTKPFMVVQFGSAILTKPGRQYPPYDTVVQSGKHHGVDPISLLIKSMNGWINTKFSAGQLREFKIGSKHIHYLDPKGCTFVPNCSDEEGEAECDHVWAQRMLVNESFADDLTLELRSDLYRVACGDESGYCVRNVIRRIELVCSI